MTTSRNREQTIKDLAAKIVTDREWSTRDAIAERLTELDNYSRTTMADFREHALALRDEGATHVSAGELTVTFGPRPVDPAAFKAAAEVALAKQIAEPEGDDAYIPGA